MNKFLVYTISDLKENSIKCTDLLYESLLFQNKNKFTFYIITNNKNYLNINFKYNYKIICEKEIYTFIGFLKYSQNIPKFYDQYFYFDSDILCYEKLENLIGRKKISLVKDCLEMSSEWFSYPFATDIDKKNFKNYIGINAGLFVFKDINFINSVRDKFLNKPPKFDLEEVMFEQSCFNYSVFNLVKNNQFNDITKYVKLFATPSEITSHTIYHFCGYEGTMDNKLSKMTLFNQEYLNKI